MNTKDADIRIDPDGTTWIRLDYMGRGYWFNKEAMDLRDFPEQIRFNNQTSWHMPYRPCRWDYSYLGAVQNVAGKYLP